MTGIATIDWFERWGTSVFSENTAIFSFFHCYSRDRTSGCLVLTRTGV